MGRQTRRGSSAGSCNSCFIIFWSIITFCLCLALVMRLRFYMDADLCYYDWYCCTWSCWNYCRRWVCRGGDYWITRPFGQDMLPPPVALALNSSESTTGAGDGEPDYWSLYVGVFCGTTASLIAMFAAIGPASQRGDSGNALCIAGTMLFAGVLHLAVTICLGVQFFTSEEQWVYNAYREDQYYKIDGTLYDYLVDDHYYRDFANVVMTTFIFCLISAIWELGFILCIFLIPSDEMSERITNVYWEPSYVGAHRANAAPPAVST
jgi:hypothetical protein